MLVELRQLSKYYIKGGVKAKVVNNISLKAGAGEVFGLLGPNGAGKTTLIRMLLDIVSPEEGEVLIDGVSGANRSYAFKQRIGYLPEERGLYKERKVIDVLEYLARLKGLSRKEAHARAKQLLKDMALADCLEQRIDGLSKGMRQKVQLISAMIHDPELLILDEPFSGLDPVNIRLVREAIRNLKRQGKTVILSTHIMSEVELLCDRIFIINKGEKVIEGDVAELKQRFGTESRAIELDELFVNLLEDSSAND